MVIEMRCRGVLSTNVLVSVRCVDSLVAAITAESRVKLAAQNTPALCASLPAPLATCCPPPVCRDGSRDRHGASCVSNIDLHVAGIDLQTCFLLGSGSVVHFNQPLQPQAFAAQIVSQHYSKCRRQPLLGTNVLRRVIR